MAFNLGQFRRDQKDTSFYTTDLSYTLEDLVTSTDSKLINYLDKQLRIDGGIKHGENYYLGFTRSQIIIPKMLHNRQR